jgi:Helicase C-terminal domain
MTAGAAAAGPQVVPDGVLFFFPSYSVMDVLTARWQVCAQSGCKSIPTAQWASVLSQQRCQIEKPQQSLWIAARRPSTFEDRLLPLQATGLWQQIEAVKPVVQEPRGTGDHFDAAMRDFYAGIDSSRGAVLFAVCRGKVNEQSGTCSVHAFVPLQFFHEADSGPTAV